MRVAQGRASMWSVLPLAELVTVAGATMLSWLSRRAGRPLVLRYGRYVRLGPERLAAAHARIHGRAMVAIFFGRLVPGMRILTVVAAGVADVPAAKFLPALAAGAFLNLATYTILGVTLGQPVLRLLVHVAFPASAVWSLTGLAVIALMLRALRRSRPAKVALAPTVATLLAGGLLAGVGGLLGANAVVGLLEFGYRVTDRPTSLGFTRSLGRLYFVLGWPVFAATAMGLALVHYRLRERGLPAALRLLVTTAVPAAATLILLLQPLRDMAGAEARATTILIVTSTALIRWAIFGLVVELLPLRIPANE